MLFRSVPQAQAEAEFQEVVAGAPSDYLAVAQLGLLYLADRREDRLVFDLQARQLGSFAVDGIPAKLACTATRHRLAVVTAEHRLFWLSFDGNVLWAADLSHDPLRHLAVSALGDQMLLASNSGCLLGCGWF